MIKKLLYFCLFFLQTLTAVIPGVGWVPPSIQEPPRGVYEMHRVEQPQLLEVDIDFQLVR